MPGMLHLTYEANVGVCYTTSCFDLLECVIIGLI